MKVKFTLHKVFWLICLVLLFFVLRPVVFLLYVYVKDQKAFDKTKTGFTKDASNLNQTKIDTLIKVSAQTDVAIDQLKKLIKQASEQHQAIAIAGAQHSMGGHTISKHGIILDMKGFDYMKFEPDSNILLTGSGALWSKIIPYLDQYGKSVRVMQSNNSFTVGGSLSVNCHGWQANYPPIASTVISFRMIDSRGQLLNCSRNENSELFSLVIGGYGLFGVILDLRLRVTNNNTYKAQHYFIQSKDYFVEFKKHVKANSNIEMAYGRININPDHFMEEAILSTYNVETGLTAKQRNTFPAFRRTLFRASVNSVYGKNLRWKAEKLGADVIDGKVFSRNKLLGEGVEIFQNTDTAYTDILHEYFVPGDSLASFIDKIKKIIPSYDVDLLNITVRNVMPDSDSFLAYAKTEMFGLVMLFSQRKDSIAENEMAVLTQNLINAAIQCHGTYYLPYRLHASKALMYRAYPKAEAFFQLKKKYDPSELFRNEFYEKYKP